jgi:5-hydroxyisourate hydrolase-like protein (transthyretin family)
MKRQRFFVGMFSVLLAMGLLSAVAAPALAAPAQPSTTRVVMEPPGAKELGKPFLLSGILQKESGEPIGNKPILFNLDGDYLGQARTDGNGRFQLRVGKDLEAGTYSLEVVFNGGHLLEKSVATTALQIRPAEVRVQTVPPVAGVTFQMDGRTFVSAADGSARIAISKTGEYRLQVLTEQYQNPSQRIEFGRWAEESYQPSRDIRVPTDGVIEVGLYVYHQVGQTFVDLDGFPVDPSRITRLTIKNAQGEVFTFPDGQPRWLPASRIARRSLGLEETKLLYSVMSVTVDGSNVVNQAQQRFYAGADNTWQISLLLYSLDVTARDGLFGTPVGKAVKLEFPDGRVESFPLNAAGKAEIHSLARGIYTMQLDGVSGMVPRAPVALSSNQVVTTKVVTNLDIAVVAALGLMAALALFFYGRPWILRLIAHHVGLRQRTDQRSRWVSIHDN